MYLTPNLQTLHLNSRTIGTYLHSPDTIPFNLADHSWDKISIASNWLKMNNPLIQWLCLQLSILCSFNDSQQPDSDDVTFGSLPFAQLSLPDQEPSVPGRRPDLILNPFDFVSEVRNEDHCSHRHPTGTVQASLAMLKYVISHGDKGLEMLLFPHLYPNGKGTWVYQGPAISRYPSHPKGSPDFIDLIRPPKSILMKPCLLL